MLGSVQDKLLRVRPPRVRITYDVETGGAIEKKELPFIVGILADLSGDLDPAAEPPPPIKDRKLVEIDRDNFDDLMKSIAPRVSIAKVDSVLPGTSGKLSGAINFSCLEDFTPIKVIGKVEPLNNLYNSRKAIRMLQAKAEGSDVLQKLFELGVAFSSDPKEDGTAVRGDLDTAFNGKKPEEWAQTALPADLEKLVKSYYTAPDGTEDAARKASLLETLGYFHQEVITRLPANNPAGASALMDSLVANIDIDLSRQLGEIMHAPNFQAVEATWRGLAYLVSRTETGALLKLRVLNATKKDLSDDLMKAVEFDQSGLFKMVYEAEYGTYGGFPYSVLVGAYEFGRDPADQDLLAKIAEVAAAAHAPFVAAADAQLFDLAGYNDLARPRDLQKIFESDELAQWKAFRDSEDSRYVTLTLPKVLLRLPYGTDMKEPKAGAKRKRVPVPAEGLVFEELKSAVPSQDAKGFLWGNPAFILAERITNAFSLYGWTAAIRGVEGGGLVEGLPVYTYTSDEGDVDMICPTQVSITDRREKELNDLGFMAICHCKKSNKAAFFGGQTTNLPKKYVSDLANSNAQISAMLPYILAASRFAHYIKVIMREKIGSFLTRGNVESFLNNWIAQYVLLDDNATQGMKAAYPLRAAQISVTDVPGKPGAYRATIFLKPHFQLEELTTSIRLVAELPA